MQIIPQPLPRHDLLHRKREPISQRHEEVPPPNDGDHNHARRGPASEQTLAAQPLAGRQRARSHGRAVLGPRLGDGESGLLESDGLDGEDEFEEGAGDEGGGEVGGEVVVQEELAAHEVEGEVVEGPGDEEEACGVVEAGAGACGMGLACVRVRG